MAVRARDRDSGQMNAQVLPNTVKETLHSYIEDRADSAATVYTDVHRAFQGMPFCHESVNHSFNVYVRNQAHVNSLESFWALLQRGYHGNYTIT